MACRDVTIPGQPPPVPRSWQDGAALPHVPADDTPLQPSPRLLAPPGPGSLKWGTALPFSSPSTFSPNRPHLEHECPGARPCSMWPCSRWPCSGWPCSRWPCSRCLFSQPCPGLQECSLAPPPGLCLLLAAVQGRASFAPHPGLRSRSEGSPGQPLGSPGCVLAPGPHPGGGTASKFTTGQV